MYSDRPQLKGFSVGLAEASFVFHVNDVMGTAVPGAAVTVTSGTYTESGQTDQNGCYKGNAQPMLESTLTITAQGYDTCTHKFLLYPVSSLANANNDYVIQAKYNNAIVPGANVTLSPIGGGTNITGTTDSQGIFQVDLDHSTLSYQVTVSDGTHVFSDKIYPFTKVSCGSSSYRIVHIISLQ